MKGTGGNSANGVSSVDFSKHRTLLVAKFRFRTDVAPIHRAAVYNRIEVIAEAGDLKRYLEQYEGCKSHSLDKLGFPRPDATFIAPVRTTGSNSREVKVYNHSWGKFSPGFDIKVSSVGIVPLEEMLNLDQLNTFMITGTVPKKE